MKIKLLYFCYFTVIALSLYCFFYPTTLARGGYVLAIHGIVVARTLCLLFAFFNIVKVFENLCKK